MGWVMPGFKKFSISRTFVGPFIAKKFKFDTGVNGGKRAIIPFYSFERIMPMDIIPSLLLRSLAILDTDEAQNLGCLELDEEDLALCTYVDPCKGDFGPLLRRCLDKIELEG
jgi:Na+-transporting NADH:ubiquinone oxidoreductase subunit A